jgi:hypothetical protein
MRLSSSRSSILLVLALAGLSLLAAPAQADGPFLSGCVGDCSPYTGSYSGSYTVTWWDQVGPCGGGACDVYLEATSGVCPYDGVQVYVLKNGSPIYSKFFVSGFTYSTPYFASIDANAYAGDSLSLVMYTASSGISVVCKRYGELLVELWF